MSSIPIANPKINQNKENVLKATKPQLQQNQENRPVPTKKSLTRAPSSHLTLTKRSSKTALRTKSSNSIRLPQPFQNQQQRSTQQQQQQLSGNFNKIRKTSTLNDLNAFGTGSNFEQTNSLTGSKKFNVQRDSPLSDGINSKRKLNIKNALGQKLFDELRQEAQYERGDNENESEYDDFEDIEFVPAKEPELPYIPDNMQRIPKKVLADVFGSASKEISEGDDGNDFKDLLNLDLTHLANNPTDPELDLEIHFNSDQEEESAQLNGNDSSGLDLEFDDEEDEAENLKKLLELYESGTKYKPSRV